MTTKPEDIERAEILLGAGMEKTEVAKLFGISFAEFERDYAETIRTGRARVRGTLQCAMYAKAIDADAEAIAFIEEMHAKNPREWPSLAEIRRQ